MIERYEPIDWYKDNRPKTFRDNETGEEISLHEYRKRRKQMASTDEGEPDEQDDELETQAFAEPAPRPRLFDVSAKRDDVSAQSSGVRRMGIAEMLAPALLGVGQSAMLFRLRNSPRQVFVPPREVTTPILAPIGRIIDRHLPVEFGMLMGEDGKDVSASLQGLGAAIVWFNEALKQYEEYRAYEQQQYEPRANGRPARDTTPAVDDSPANWAGDIIQRVRRGNDANGTAQPASAPDSAGSANAPAVRELGSSEAASRIGDLLRLDAEGIMRRGLGGE